MTCVYQRNGQSVGNLHEPAVDEMEFIALLIDGKTLHREQILLAVGQIRAGKG